MKITIRPAITEIGVRYIVAKKALFGTVYWTGHYYGFVWVSDNGGCTPIKYFNTPVDAVKAVKGCYGKGVKVMDYFP